MHCSVAGGGGVNDQYCSQLRPTCLNSEPPTGDGGFFVDIGIPSLTPCSSLFGCNPAVCCKYIHPDSADAARYANVTNINWTNTTRDVGSQNNSDDGGGFLLPYKTISMEIQLGVLVAFALLVA
jgi:hypothetical protein